MTEIIPSPKDIIKNRIRYDREKADSLIRRCLIEIEDRFARNEDIILCKVYQSLNDKVKDYILEAFEPSGWSVNFRESNHDIITTIVFESKQ